MTTSSAEPGESIDGALTALRTQFSSRFAGAETEQLLRDENAKILGKKGELTAIPQGDGGAPSGGAESAW